MCICACPPPTWTVLFLLCKKFPEGETWSYLGLKARIAHTEKLIIKIFQVSKIFLTAGRLSVQTARTVIVRWSQVWGDVGRDCSWTTFRGHICWDRRDQQERSSSVHGADVNTTCLCLLRWEFIIVVQNDNKKFLQVLVKHQSWQESRQLEMLLTIWSWWQSDLYSDWCFNRESS